mgnify:CR=1 FL=1
MRDRYRLRVREIDRESKRQKHTQTRQTVVNDGDELRQRNGLDVARRQVPQVARVSESNDRQRPFQLRGEEESRKGRIQQTHGTGKMQDGIWKYTDNKKQEDSHPPSPTAVTAPLQITLVRSSGPRICNNEGKDSKHIRCQGGSVM